MGARQTFRPTYLIPKTCSYCCGSVMCGREQHWVTPTVNAATAAVVAGRLQALFVLFESASGFALFDIKGLDEIGQSADKVQASVRCVPAPDHSAHKVHVTVLTQMRHRTAWQLRFSQLLFRLVLVPANHQVPHRSVSRTDRQ